MTHSARILAIHPVTHNVRRYVVERPEGYTFEAGQATEVSIDRPGWTESDQRERTRATSVWLSSPWNLTVIPRRPARASGRSSSRSATRVSNGWCARGGPARRWSRWPRATTRRRPPT